MVFRFNWNFTAKLSLEKPDPSVDENYLICINL